MKRGFQPRAAGLPSPIDDLTFSQACRLDPTQHVAGALAVIMDEPGVPEEGEHERYDYVDENETPHGRLCGEIVLLIDATAQGEEEEKSVFGRPMGASCQESQKIVHCSAKNAPVSHAMRRMELPNGTPLIQGHGFSVIASASTRSPAGTGPERSECYRSAHSTGKGDRQSLKNSYPALPNRSKKNKSRTSSPSVPERGTGRGWPPVSAWSS